VTRIADDALLVWQTSRTAIRRGEHSIAERLPVADGATDTPLASWDFVFERLGTER